MPDRIGQQLGHYRLTHLLGHGGFADVYLGEHIYLTTRAAIKVLDTRLSQEEIEHFCQEARIIARLEHPHIVRVLDFGVQDGIPFLVMSYASHGTLRQRYPAGSHLPPGLVVSYVKQIAAALYYAHNEKLVHRDIKPENMLLGRNDEVFLSDFGLAVITQSSSRTALRDVSGTIAYMAPEQAKGRPQPASDQYALGVIVYEWLCGTRPFTGTYEEVVVQHALSQPPSLQELVPAISPALEAVVMKALEKEPTHRFASVRDFAHALELAYQTEQITDTPHTVNIPLTPVPPTGILTAQESSYATERNQSSDIIYTVAWSPDRRRIAYGGRDRAIQVRGTTSGASTLLYRGHTGSVTTIAWSADSKHIASASLDRTIQVWHATSGQKIATYDSHAGMVYALAWSPDITYLASSSSGSDNSVHLWEIATGSERLTYRGHTYWVRALAWSPDGRYVASGSWREIQVWERTTGRKIFTHRGHNSWVRAVAWSPDGTRIASAGEDKIVHVWEPHNKGHAIVSYHGHSDWVTTITWSPDAVWLASASKDNSVHIWDAATASSVSIHHIRTTSAYAITWLADSKHLVAASGNGSVQVWQVG